jgi:hypothetical protein
MYKVSKHGLLALQGLMFDCENGGSEFIRIVGKRRHTSERIVSQSLENATQYTYKASQKENCGLVVKRKESNEAHFLYHYSPDLLIMNFWN